MKFTEAQLESAIIELLEAEGYPHVLGGAIDPPDGATGRQPQEVLIKADLRAFLGKQYADDDITPQEIEAVINQLEAYSAADLYESNKAIMKLVCDGFLLKREDHTQKDHRGEAHGHASLYVPAQRCALPPKHSERAVGALIPGRLKPALLGSRIRGCTSRSLGD